MDLHERIWAAVEPTVYVSREDFLAGLEGWGVHAHESAGEVVGAVMTRGPELHFITFGPRWSLTRATLRAYVYPILEAHGHLITRTPKDDARQQRFNQRLGFKQVGEDEFYIHYRLDRKGSSLCQL